MIRIVATAAAGVALPALAVQHQHFNQEVETSQSNFDWFHDLASSRRRLVDKTMVVDLKKSVISKTKLDKAKALAASQSKAEGIDLGKILGKKVKKVTEVDTVETKVDKNQKITATKSVLAAAKSKKKTKAKLTSEDVIRMYRGLDFAGTSAVMEGIAKLKGPESDTPVKVHLFGLQNSGTSLMWSLMRLNFGQQVEFVSSDQKLSGVDEKPWRYANVRDLFQSQPHDENGHLEIGSFSTISVIRNPFSWVQAMRNNSEGSGFAECFDGKDWLTRECTHEHPIGAQSDAPLTCPSVGGIWNQWVNSYTNAHDYGFKRRLVVTYEALVRTPDLTLERVANFLSLSGPTAGWFMPYASSPRPEDSLGSKEAIAELVERTYMERFTQREKQQACQRLDKDLLSLYGYPVYECFSFMGGDRQGILATATDADSTNATTEDQTPRATSASDDPEGQLPALAAALS